MGQVAIPVSAFSCRKLAQPFVEQYRRLWLVRRIRRTEVARAGMAAADRSARVDIMVELVPPALPGFVGSQADCRSRRFLNAGTGAEILVPGRCGS
jgi:hypothetical protein